jgi:drug/metabolite transporter (DMT)-like permease
VTELVLLILFQTGTAHLIRFNQRVTADTEWVGLLQYVVAMALVAGWWALHPDRPLRWEEAVFGAAMGSMGVTGYFLFNFGIQLSGVAIMQSMGRLSIAVPVAASIWIWQEEPSALQVVGLVLVTMAVPLLVRTTALVSPRQSAWKIPVLLGHFVAMGVMGLVFKAFIQAVPDGAGPGFYLAAFGCAGMVAAVPCARNVRPIGKRDLAAGAVLGVVNLGTKVSMVLALGALPGIVVFPVSTAGTVILTAILSMILWNERYGPRAVLGLLSALAGIVTIQLGA